MRRITFLTGILASALLVAAGAYAATQQAWDKAAFDAAQAAGKPILIVVHAPWCPTCAKQAPILSELAKEPGFKDMVMLTVDFDSQKELLNSFGVRMQSTLIVFHGKTETGRSTGETDAGKIRALLSKANS